MIGPLNSIWLAHQSWFHYNITWLLWILNRNWIPSVAAVKAISLNPVIYIYVLRAEGVHSSKWHLEKCSHSCCLLQATVRHDVKTEASQIVAQPLLFDSLSFAQVRLDTPLIVIQGSKCADVTHLMHGVQWPSVKIALLHAQFLQNYFVLGRLQFPCPTLFQSHPMSLLVNLVAWTSWALGAFQLWCEHQWRAPSSLPPMSYFASALKKTLNKSVLILYIQDLS